jgi:hypothetical protein
MSEELFAIAPLVHRSAEIEQRILVEPQVPPQHHTLEEIRAIDNAFASGDEQTDAAMGLMGLCLSAPWLIDFLTDQMRPPSEEEEESPRPNLKEKEEE